MSPAEEIARYLIRRGMLRGRDVSSPSFGVVERSGRNRCFEFVLSGRGGWFVKQGCGVAGRAAVAREAWALRKLRDSPHPQALHRSLPRVARYGARSGILVLDRLRSARSLEEHARTTGTLPPRALRGAGAALGSLHGMPPPRSRSLRGADRRSKIPWPLSIPHPTIGALREMSPASLQIVRSTQRVQGFADALDELRDRWRSDSFVHGDLRWENCLIPRSGAPTAVIDWELAGAGDPAWDVGAFLGEGLRHWAFGTPGLVGTAPLFWNSYIAARGIVGSESDALRARSVRLSGAWLLGRLVELAQERDRLDPLLLRAIQLAADVVAAPDDAARELYQLP